MQQRRLRLGDIVDDYCPRERRITNHAIVAMIEDEVKQTRCTTCDADHEYKQARVPAQRRKKDTSSALGDVLAGTPRKRAAVEEPRDEVDAADISFETADALDAEAGETSRDVPTPDVTPAAANGLDAPEMRASSAEVEDEGPVHRPLIRATLPRPEGQIPERKLPEFTIRQRGVGENNGHRQGRGPRRMQQPHGGSVRHGSGQTGQPSRFGGPRHGQSNRPGPGQPPRHGSGQAQRQGNRPGQGHPGQQGHGRRGGRKRGR